MSNDWYCLVDDSVLGPLSDDEVLAMAATGALAPTDMVRKETDGRWVEAKRLKGIVFPDGPTPESRPSPPRHGPPQPIPPVAMLDASTNDAAEVSQSLITCTDCGASISKRAVACPNCGASEVSGSVAPIAGVIVGILLAVFLADLVMQRALEVEKQVYLAAVTQEFAGDMENLAEHKLAEKYPFLSTEMRQEMMVYVTDETDAQLTTLAEESWRGTYDTFSKRIHLMPRGYVFYAVIGAVIGGFFGWSIGGACVTGQHPGPPTPPPPTPGPPGQHPGQHPGPPPPPGHPYLQVLVVPAH